MVKFYLYVNEDLALETSVNSFLESILSYDFDELEFVHGYCEDCDCIFIMILWCNNRIGYISLERGDIK